MNTDFKRAVVMTWLAGSLALPLLARPLPTVEGQPLGANVLRVIDALDLLGAPLPTTLQRQLRDAASKRDAKRLQQLLDLNVLFVVSLNPEVRVKVARGAAAARLQQGGFTPVLVKIINESTATKTLRLTSPQSGPVYSGEALLSMQRQAQLHLRSDGKGGRERFLQVELFQSPPMTAQLSGLEVEYAIALIYSSEAGKREATIVFDVGQGTQDLGFRAEAPTLFDIKPATGVKLIIKDVDGKPTTARFTFRNTAGHVFPPQPKRLAPDFFFQQQIYRHSGEHVLLPPGEFMMEYSRGPEYKLLTRRITVPARGNPTLTVQLERWVDTAQHGFYSGDHHIHAAGCAHYTSPSEGVAPADIFRQVKGEGMNVGCVLTWGFCWDFQRKFFTAGSDSLSEPLTLLKYDIEVSGFGSQSLGHVCLLNLRDQTYPGSDGTKDKGWPTWTTPLMRWAKAQGAFTGYAHSASGLAIEPTNAAKRLLAQLDTNKDTRVTPNECAGALLPESFATIDANADGALTETELVASHDRVADRLPNLAIPEMNGVGAMECAVTTALGLCDFISAMDTARIQEWNTWYHLMNCGFPLKVSGETDFPCMSSTRVGQGRVYVQLGRVERVDFRAWCEGLARGRSYVSDGYAHALQFSVNDTSAGGEVQLAQPAEVTVKARVAFSSQTPLDVKHGTVAPTKGLRVSGDTVVLQAPLFTGQTVGGMRTVEVVVNGLAVASQQVPADDQPHDLEFKVKLDRSSWVALRHFPQMHTNPVNVLIGGKPIRASRQSAQWAIGVIDQLWRNRERNIAPPERDEARATFERVKEMYRRIAEESS